MEALLAAAKAAAAFAATNVDDLVLLTLWFSQRSARLRPRHIVTGQLAGFSALVAVSLVGVVAGRLAPREWLGLLGLVPIALGVRAWRARGEGPQSGPAMGAGGVAAVTFANGGDNVGVYAPLFVGLDGAGIAVTLAVFYAMLLAGCALGRRLADHPAVARRLARGAHRWVPWVLVALGLVILAESGTHRLLWR